MNAWIEAKGADNVARIVEDKGEMLVQRYHTEDVHFAIWLHVLNVNVQRLTGMSFDDLEDWGYRDAYDGDMTPRDAAVEMLRDNGYEDALSENIE